MGKRFRAPLMVGMLMVVGCTPQQLAALEAVNKTTTQPSGYTASTLASNPSPSPSALATQDPSATNPPTSAGAASPSPSYVPGTTVATSASPLASLNPFRSPSPTPSGYISPSPSPSVIPSPSANASIAPTPSPTSSPHQYILGKPIDQYFVSNYTIPTKGYLIYNALYKQFNNYKNNYDITRTINYDLVPTSNNNLVSLFNLSKSYDSLPLYYTALQDDSIVKNLILNWMSVVNNQGSLSNLSPLISSWNYAGTETVNISTSLSYTSQKISTTNTSGNSVTYWFANPFGFVQARVNIDNSSYDIVSISPSTP